MAELADAQDLKSCCSDTVPVRFRSRALYVRVAQLDRASGYGPEGRGFESCHAHFIYIKVANEYFRYVLVSMEVLNRYEYC